MPIGGTSYGRAKQRNDTVEGFAAANPVLALGELVVSFDGTVPVVKVGDGVRAWSDLPELGSGGGGGGGSVDTAFVLNRANHTGFQSQGTITNLVEALALLAPKDNPTFTGAVSGVTKAHVGLSSVPNVDATNAANITTGILPSLARLPEGASFAIYTNGSTGWQTHAGAAITARPTGCAHLQMIAYGGTVAPTFLASGDIWYPEAPPA